MKPIQTRFEPDPALDHIEVIVRAPDMDPDVCALLEGLGSHEPSSLAVWDADSTMIAVPFSRIVSVSVLGRQISVVTEDGRYVSRRTLQSIEETLDPNRFVRISRFEIVNLEKVLRYDFTLSGTLRLELTGGMETWASRRNIPQIRKKLTEMR